MCTNSKQFEHHNNMSWLELWKCIDSFYVGKLQMHGVHAINVLQHPEGPLIQSSKDLFGSTKLVSCVCSESYHHNTSPVQIMDVDNRFMLVYNEETLTAQICCTVVDSSGLLLCFDTLLLIEGHFNVKQYAFRFANVTTITPKILPQIDQAQYNYILNSNIFNSVDKFEQFCSHFIDWANSNGYLKHQHLILEIQYTEKKDIESLRKYMISFEDDYYPNNTSFGYELARQLEYVNKKE